VGKESERGVENEGRHEDEHQQAHGDRRGTEEGKDSENPMSGVDSQRTIIGQRLTKSSIQLAVI